MSAALPSDEHFPRTAFALLDGAAFAIESSTWRAWKHRLRDQEKYWLDQAARPNRAPFAPLILFALDGHAETLQAELAEFVAVVTGFDITTDPPTVLLDHPGLTPLLQRSAPRRWRARLLRWSTPNEWGLAFGACLTYHLLNLACLRMWQAANQAPETSRVQAAIRTHFAALGALPRVLAAVAEDPYSPSRTPAFQSLVAWTRANTSTSEKAPETRRLGHLLRAEAERRGESVETLLREHLPGSIRIALAALATSAPDSGRADVAEFGGWMSQLTKKVSNEVDGYLRLLRLDKAKSLEDRLLEDEGRDFAAWEEREDLRLAWIAAGEAPLTDPEYAAFWGRVAGYSGAEIAAAHGRSESTVGNQRATARGKLRHAVGE